MQAALDSGTPVSSCQHAHAAAWPQVMGSEGRGLRTLVRRCCHQLLAVDGPLGASPDGVDSLNVGVAGGILLHRLLMAQGSGQKGVGEGTGPG